MKIEICRRKRLSIDVLAEDHRQIKACAAFHGMTIRQYILESVHERLRQESEKKMRVRNTIKTGLTEGTRKPSTDIRILGLPA